MFKRPPELFVKYLWQLILISMLATYGKYQNINPLITVDFPSGFSFLEVWVFKLQQKAITQNKVD